MTSASANLFAALRRFQADLERLGVRVSAVEVDGDPSLRAVVAACIHTVGFRVDPPSEGGAVTVAGVTFKVKAPWQGS